MTCEAALRARWHNTLIASRVSKAAAGTTVGNCAEAVETDVGLALVNILFFAPASDPASLPIRQSAAVILQKYIQQSWSPVHAQFRGQEFMVRDDVKEEIRRMLLHGLPLEERKLRTACVSCRRRRAECSKLTRFALSGLCNFHYCTIRLS